MPPPPDAHFGSDPHDAQHHELNLHHEAPAEALAVAVAQMETQRRILSKRKTRRWKPRRKRRSLPKRLLRTRQPPNMRPANRSLLPIMSKKEWIRIPAAWRSRHADRRLRRPSRARSRPQRRIPAAAARPGRRAVGTIGISRAPAGISAGRRVSCAVHARPANRANNRATRFSSARAHAGKRRALWLSLTRARIRMSKNRAEQGEIRPYTDHAAPSAPASKARSCRSAGVPPASCYPRIRFGQRMRARAPALRRHSHNGSRFAG